MKRYTKITDIIGGIISLIGILISDILAAIFCCVIFCLPIDLSNTRGNPAVYWILGGFVFIVCFVIIIFGITHYIKWFIINRMAFIKCHDCGKEVAATRKEVWDPDEHTTVVVLDLIESIQRTIRVQRYRPMLHYKCPTCGHEEYICPYCHKPVDKHDNQCPHCKKGIVRNTRI